MKVPVFVPKKVVAPKGAARRRLGSAFALPQRLYFPPPRRGACARRVPTCGLNCRCSATGVPLRGDRVAVGYPRYRSALLGAARLVGVGSCLAFPNDGSAAFPSAALCRASPFPNERDWDSPPRPAERVAMSVLPLCLDLPLRSAGRSPFKVVVVCRRCVLRASQRTLRETGATRAARPPKTERGNSEANEFAPRLPRSVFRLRRASPPIQWGLDDSAHDLPATPARVSPRAAFGYSLAKGTLQGRCGDTSRGARESFSRQ